MRRTGSRAPELALPAASLVALRRALIAQVGPDAAARALQQAGSAAGDALYPLLHDGEERSDAAPVGDVGSATFWRRFTELFARRGWGHLEHEQPHPGIGALRSTDWVEAAPDGSATRPSCFFTGGLLANLLGRAAGGDVSVLEVECRSRGDAECRFLFGNDDTLYTVFESVRSGNDVGSSIGQLM